jgi:hypothetical protein
MKIIITEAERDYLLTLLKAEDEVLKKKLLKYKRERKNATYKKCEKVRKEKFARLEEIIRSNYKITNEELMVKLGVSKATFYIVYASKARELKRMYKSQSLF